MESDVAAIGWSDVGNLSEFDDYYELRKKVYETYPDNYESEGGAGVTAGMLWNFVNSIKERDVIFSPKKDTRELLIGRVRDNDYRYDSTVITDMPNLRNVDWLKKIQYDHVPNAIWRSMTAWQTIFQLTSQDAIQATENLINAITTPSLQQEVPKVDVLTPATEGERLFKDSTEKSLEIIATHFNKFEGYDFQEVVWGVLKAAGLYPKPMRKGRDQGIDIEAYRDPLQIGPPRILVQVKHREGSVSGPEMREFLGAMTRKDDVGLFISSGGFKSEAQKAAEKSDRPVNLMNWDDFIGLFLEVYDKLDNEIKAEVPIDDVKVLRDPKAKPDRGE